MKIVLVGPYSPTIGGVVSHIVNLHQRLIHDGWDVQVLDVISIKQKSLDDNIINVNRNPFLLILSTIKLLFNGYKVFHFNISQKGIYITILLPLLILFRAKYLITFHSGDIINSIKKGGFVQRITTYLNCYFSSRVLFVNQESALKYEEIYNFKNADSYASYIKKNTDDLIRNRKYLKDGTLRIVDTGLWQKYYRYEDCLLLIDALKIKEIPIELTYMIGKFAQDNNYKKEVLSLSKEYDNVIVIEDCKEPLKLFSECDVLIRTSSVDSYGLSVAEALSVGAYAIATDVCKRPVGSILYPVGDVEKLSLELEKIYEKLKNGLYPDINDSLEDGFEKISKIYKSFY